MKKLLLLCLLSLGAQAQVINWLDPLKYEKPKPVKVNKPSEATGNKYWVDLTSGSGTTCSEASPCGSMDSVLGKTGLNGGPAIIYVKGTGSMSWFNDTVQGTGDVDCRVSACTNWILVRTWPKGSTGCASECTATITGNSNMDSATVNHIIWDGGPDMKIRFKSDGAVGTYVNNINGGGYRIIMRTQMFCANTGSDKTEGWQIGASSVPAHVYFINNEFYGCDNTGDQASAVYVGPGPTGGYNDFVFQNNIVRDMYGEGIEINPRVNSVGLVVSGNAFHNIGFGTCGGGWNCRPAITINSQNGASSTHDGAVIENNLMFHISSGCIWDRGDTTSVAVAQIRNNTCYDYGTGSGDPNPEGISGISGNCGTGNIRNNVVYEAGGVNPFGSGCTLSNNACKSGESCGASSQSITGTDWESTDTNNRKFMWLKSFAPAKDTGVTIAGVTIDYSGKARPINSIYDIGAFEQGTAGSTPTTPSGTN